MLNLISLEMHGQPDGFGAGTANSMFDVAGNRQIVARFHFDPFAAGKL
jgi:hypothetical protein